MSGDITAANAPRLAQPGQQANNRVMSIVYAKKTENAQPMMKAELRTAQVHESLLATAINSTGILDYNNGANFSGNDYGKYTGFSQNNEAYNGICLLPTS